MSHRQTAPQWLSEEPLIQRLLNSFIDKLERGVRPQLRVSVKTTPELYDFEQDVDYLWALVESLDKDHHLITIKKSRVKPYQPTYEGAQLLFLPEREEQVRQWLERPAIDPYALVWQHELEKLSVLPPAAQGLAQTIVRIPELGAEKTLRGFLRIDEVLRKPMTLRALSARCFQGDSKVLERYEPLVRQLYPDLASHILPRPLLLAVYLPQSFQKLLFVENQDSFLALAQRRPPTTALIYSAGFRGSALRMREPEQVVFSYLDATAPSCADFERFWFSDRQDRLVHFWGDLDYAAMGILKAVRQSFTEASAWLPGYDPMLEQLQAGEGHSSTSANKGLQKDPGVTGCQWADDRLLPAIRQASAFVDQEFVDISLLRLNG